MNKNTLVKKKLLFIIPILLAVLSPSIASAFPFTVNPGDKSLFYLSQIFGGIVGSVVLGGGTAPALGEMVAVFNGWFLSIGVFIMSFVVITSTINTAQEGEAFGKKLSVIWAPTKTLVGVLLLLPYPGSYYSVIQTSVMWAIVQGVGAANQTWDVALDYYVQGMSPSTVEKETFATQSSGKFDTLKNTIAPIEYKQLDSTPSKTQIPFGIYEPVLCVVMANALYTGTVMHNDIGGKIPNARAVAQAAIDMGITQESLSSLTIEEFENLNPGFMAKYNIHSSIGDSGLRAMIQAGLDSNSIDGVSDIISSFGDQFTTYSVVPRDGNGKLIINFASGNSSGKVISFVNFGMKNASGTMTSLRNICGHVTVTTTVTAKEATGSDSASSGQNKVSIANMLESAVDGKNTAVVSAAGKIGELVGSVVYGFATPRSSISTYSTYRPRGTLSSGQPAPSGLVLAARTTIQANLSLLLKYKIDTNKQGLANLLKNTGWSTAGITYFLFAAASSSSGKYLATTSTGYLVVPGTKYNELFNNAGVYSEQNALEARRADLITYLNNDNSASVDVSSDFKSSFAKSTASLGPFSFFTKISDGWTAKWAGLITGGGGSNPIVKIAKFGQELLLSLEIIWIVLAFVIILMSLLSFGTFYGNPMFMVTYSIMTNLCIPIMGFCAMVWPIAASLGFYIPMLPYIVFTVCFLGWLILVIEAIICAQLFGLSVMAPGDEEIGKSKTGLILIIGIVMRPTLMLFGFFLGSRLFTTFITYLDFGMNAMINGIWVLHPAFAKMLLPLFLYMGIVMAVISQCFALVYKLPDRILRWIGGPVEQTDIEAIKATETKFDEGAGQGGEMLGAGTKSMSKMAETGKKNAAGIGKGELSE